MVSLKPNRPKIEIDRMGRHSHAHVTHVTPEALRMTLRVDPSGDLRVDSSGRRSHAARQNVCLYHTYVNTFVYTFVIAYAMSYAVVKASQMQWIDCTIVVD